MKWMHVKSAACVLTALIAVAWPMSVKAQIAPTGAHYAGRATDTGHAALTDSGGYAAAVPFELPPSRGGLPVPVQLVSGSRGFGAAGVGWDVPLSFVQFDFIGHRRPAFTQYSALFDDLGRRLPKNVKVAGRTDTRELYFTGFDAVGRELSREERLPNFSGNQTVSYDPIGRLRASTRTHLGNLSNAAQWTFNYDGLGNTLALTDHLGTADATSSYQTQDRDRICSIGYGDGGVPAAPATSSTTASATSPASRRGRVIAGSPTSTRAPYAVSRPIPGSRPPRRASVTIRSA